jgi:hypothetical protein
MEVMMEKVPVRRLWTVCSILLFAVGLVGCTTNITPPSGPVGTEVCFNPAPFTFIDYQTGQLCPWILWFRLPDEPSFRPYPIYTDNKCFTIPSDYPFGEYTVTVAGQMGLGCDIHFAGQFPLYGSFTVTE